MRPTWNSQSVNRQSVRGAAEGAVRTVLTHRFRWSAMEWKRLAIAITSSQSPKF